MRQWLESVYSDGTESFVSNPQPSLGETVKIRIRMYEAAPVKHVFLRTAPNGLEKLTEAVLYKKENGLAYYEAELTMTETRMQYHFYLVCEDVIFYYNQKGITTYVPEIGCDFVLLTDYRQPSWVKGAVFYQIFPERFCNGNPDNDVKNGEYEYQGHKTIKKNWEDRPMPYEEGFSLDFFGGDLEGIRQKIPYLKDLGVTAVYLNPIFYAPSVHKYDCIDYFHVDPHFGGDEALADLSKALHENGMKLILDISINHTGCEHRWMNRDGVFFDRKEGAFNNPESAERDFYFWMPEGKYYHAWLGFDTLPTLNYTSEELRKRIYRAQDSVLRKWMKPPYSIDGWRFDVADTCARNNEVQLAHEIWPEIHKAIREENKDAYILAEDWGDCTEYLQGKEWDSPMNYFGCGRVLRQFLGLPDLFSVRNEILRNVKYKMPAKEVEERVLQYLAKIPYVFWQNQFNLMESHDASRVHNFECVDREEYRGAVIMQFMLIGAPSVYYGTEVGIDGGVQGDDGYRYPMPWSQIPGRNPEMYEFYKTLMHLKKDRKALKDGGMKFIYAEGGILALARFCEKEIFVAVMSTEEEDRSIRLPLGVLGVENMTVTSDVFGKELHYEKADKNSILLQVGAHQAYLMEISL